MASRTQRIDHGWALLCLIFCPVFMASKAEHQETTTLGPPPFYSPSTETSRPNYFTEFALVITVDRDSSLVTDDTIGPERSVDEDELLTVYDYISFDVTTIETDNMTTVDVDIVSGLNGTWSWYPISWSWTTVLQLNSAIVGIVGNAIVIIVVFSRRVSLNSTDILIGSLAVADLFSSFAIIPVPTIKYVPSTWLGEVYCRVVIGQIFMWFFVTASIFTLTAISVERYVAVVYPFTFRRIFSLHRTSIYIILIYTICVINYITYFYFFIKVNHATHTCQVPKDPPSFRFFGGLSQVTFKFVCPLFVMVITQALIIITLHRQAKKFNLPHNTNKVKVLKMLLMVVITFMVCWTPSQMSFLLYSAGIVGPQYLYSPRNRIFTVLGFYNSCANPIIYTISNAQFRRAVKSVLTRKGNGNVSAFGIAPDTNISDIDNACNVTNVQRA